ncbi:MAG: hypothetical protein WC819_01690 [Parcubacteria group bacterium]|jgi:hypothetical protein
MGPLLIENIQEIVEKYPFPKIHRILACLIVALLKIRHHPNYLSESIEATTIAKRGMTKVLRDLDHAMRVEFEMKIFAIIQIMALFAELKDGDVDAINQYCEKITPTSEETLKGFMRNHFNADLKIDPVYSDSDFAIQLAILETMSGLYDEKFVLCPSEKITDEIITQTIIDFFANKGFSLYKKSNHFVLMKKDDELINIVFSNYDDSIHITVENVS